MMANNRKRKKTKMIKRIIIPSFVPDVVVCATTWTFGISPSYGLVAGVLATSTSFSLSGIMYIGDTVALAHDPVHPQDEEAHVPQELGVHPQLEPVHLQLPS